MKGPTAARLAWIWAGLAATLQLSALALLLLSFSSPVDLPAALELTPGTPIAFVGFLAYPLIGGFIAGRRPAHPIGWLLLAFSGGMGVANILYLYSVYGLFVSAAPLVGAGVAAWVDVWFWIISLCPLPAVLLLYPSTAVPSPGWKWPLRLCLLPAALAAGIGVTTWGEPPRRLLLTDELPFMATAFQAAAIPALLVLILFGVAALVVRFRRGSWEERQQIKWVALGSSYLLLSGVVVTALPDLLPPLVAELLSIAGFISVPAAIAVAIFRYRLYAIDLIINRTLVYATLSALLGLTYFALVAGASSLAGESSVTVAGATLAVAALFQPLRRRVQSFIDRSFYRNRYNASRTLEIFSARLREEVDLDAMTAQLLELVRETMHPRHASLWLKK
jgi:hypothetical protein